MLTHLFMYFVNTFDVCQALQLLVLLSCFNWSTVAYPVLDLMALHSHVVCHSKITLANSLHGSFKSHLGV